MSLLIMLLAISSVSLASAQNDAGSSSDAPDVIDNAISLNYDTVYSGEIGNTLTNSDNDEDNHDYFKVSVTQQSNISVYFEVTNPGVTSLTTVTIHSQEGLVIAIETIFNDETPFYLNTHILSSQTIYLQINSFSDYVNYDFSLSTEASSYQQNDAGTSGDTSLSAPKSIELDTAYSGLIGNGEVNSAGILDQSDWYTVSVPGEGYLECSANFDTPDSPDLTLGINIDGLNPIITESISVFGSSITTTAPVWGADTFYINLNSFSWNASYSLTCTYMADTIPLQNDAGTGDDTSEEYATANTISLNTTVTGTIGEKLLEKSDNARDDIDVYKFETPTYGQLDITLDYISSTEDFGGGTSLRVYNHSDIFESSYLTLSVSTFTTSEEGSIILDAGSSYYIELISIYDNTTYSFDISHQEMEKVDDSPTDTSSETTTTTSETTTSSSEDSTNQDDTSSSTSEEGSQSPNNSEETEAPFSNLFWLFTSIIGLTVVRKLRIKYLK